MSTHKDTNLLGLKVYPLCSLPKNDMSGAKLGRLTVVSFLGRKNRQSYYNCVCDCGNVGVFNGYKLLSGHTKSCGCLHAEKNKEIHTIDISGKRYGRLVVLNNYYRKNKNTYWKVACECGIEKYVNYVHLVEGRTKSCGCIKKEMMSSKSGEKHHWWTGGHKAEYPKEWTEELKDSVRNRDNRTCQYPSCTYSDAFEKRKLDVHHINGDKGNCSGYNLVSLCHSHHKKIELQRQKWEGYFYTLTNDYEHRTEN